MAYMIINLKHYDCLIMEKLKDSYPFASLHIHSEDAAWLRRRWDKYCSAAKALAAERAKEAPDILQVNCHIGSVMQHKRAICDFMSRIYSRASRRMLREAFGEDIEEWMHEHGMKIASALSIKKERDKKY